MKPDAPTAENRYLNTHVARLLASFRHWTGKDLVNPLLSMDDQARELFYAPFVVLSHDPSSDPMLNYANQAGLALFEVSWNELVVMPSRLTAQAPEQAERSRFLEEVSRRGFIDNYTGIRITKNGRRFAIERATVWNLLDENGTPYGQAASFAEWRFLK
jgi:MEKHLA domain-containing protein